MVQPVTLVNGIVIAFTLLCMSTIFKSVWDWAWAAKESMTRHDGPMVLMIVFMMTGCATAQCKPLHPYQIGGKTIYPVVCPREKMDKGCAHHDPDTRVNACAWTRSDMPNKCWIIAADDEAGMKAIFHEHAHCAGADENTARCSDWPGTEGAPEGQYCDKAWPRGL